MAILATDNFDRANGDLGASWDDNTGEAGMEIFSNMAAYTSGSFDSSSTNNTATWPDNQYSKVTLGQASADGVGTGYGPSCREATGSTRTYYRLIGNASGYELGRFVAGTFTSKSSGSGTTFTAGDTLELRVSGSGASVVLKMFKNGTQFGGDIADASGGINSGRAGIAYSSTANSNDGIASWEGGSLGSDTSLPVTASTLTLTGQAVALQSKVAAAQGTLSLTGQAVTLIANASFVLAVTAATLSLTGQVVTLRPAAPVTQASLVLAPQSVALITGGSSTLPVAPATLVLTGKEVPCQFSSAWTHGVLTLTGQNASDKIFVTSATLSATGKPASVGLQLVPSPGALTLVGFDVGLNYNFSFTLAVSPSSMALTGRDVAMTVTTGEGISDRIGQNAIQIQAFSGLRETAPAAAAPGGSEYIKVNPGWYVYDSFGASDSFTTITNDGNIPAVISEIQSMTNVKGLFHDLTWGAIERSFGVYNFGLIDQMLSLCQSAGKRLVICVMWSAISAGDVNWVVSSGTFPAYLRDTLYGIPGETPTPGILATLGANGLPPRVDARVHIPDVMDRFLAMMQALSDRYNDHPWFEGISTYDTSPAIGTLDPSFTQARWQGQLVRFMQQMKVIWPNTNVFMSMDHGFGSVISQRQAMVQAAEDNRMVLSGIDVKTAEFPPYKVAGPNSTPGGTQEQRIYQGIDGTKDFRSTLANGPRMSSGNLGGTSLPTAAQANPSTLLNNVLLPILRDSLNSTWVFIPRKIVGVGGTAGFGNNQFWTAAAAGYTLFHPTIKEFLQQSAGAIALNSSPPPNYAGIPIITGGT